MKKEFHKIPDLREIELNLPLQANPFETKEIQDFLTFLASQRNEQPYYSEIEAEFEILAERILELQKEASSRHQELVETYGLLNLGQLEFQIIENIELSERLESEIDSLEKQAEEAPLDGDKADQIIQQALQLLIKGKTYKRSKVELENQKRIQNYESQTAVYLELKVQFDQICSSYDKLVTESSQLLNQSREALIPEEIPENDQTLRLKNKLEFNQTTEEVNPYNKISLLDFIESLEAEEHRVEKELQAPHPEVEIEPEAAQLEEETFEEMSTEVAESLELPEKVTDFQMNFMMTSIPKQNLRSRKSRKQSK